MIPPDTTPVQSGSDQNIPDSTGDGATQSRAGSYRYVLRIRDADIRVGAIPMAMRMMLKQAQIQIRVVGCDRRLQFDSRMATVNAPDNWLLLESSADLPDAVERFAKLIGIRAAGLSKYDSQRAATDGPPFDQTWFPLDPSFCETIYLLIYDGPFAYQLRGDIRLCDLGWAVWYARDEYQMTIGVDQPKADALAAVARNVTLVLRLDQDNEAAVREVAELVCDGPYQMEKIQATPAMVSNVAPAPSTSTSSPPPPARERYWLCGSMNRHTVDSILEEFLSINRDRLRIVKREIGDGPEAVVVGRLLLSVEPDKEGVARVLARRLCSDDFQLTKVPVGVAATSSSSPPPDAPGSTADPAPSTLPTSQVSSATGVNDASAPGLAMPDVLEAALEYYQRGFSVVPQLTGAKQPCVKWKPFQTQRPTEQQIRGWLANWPKAGLAVVLGPVSNLFVIDVDGEDAHNALVARLGAEPQAPKVLSGSGQPFRYHLFFRHPVDVTTRAKSTPWQPKLEFRGRGGIVILPPSLHHSGNRYQWAPGQSLEDLALPDVPQPILEALQERARQDAMTVTVKSAGHSNELLDKVESETLLRHARSYLAKMDPAIAGQRGDTQTYKAFRILVKDFSLSAEQAWPLLKEYNQRCQPPWDEADLRRKLEEAHKQPGKQGCLLPRLAKQNTVLQPVAPTPSHDRSPALPASPFLGNVPDFVLADWFKAQPTPPPLKDGKRQRGRQSAMKGIRWLGHCLLIAQRSSTVIIPDILLAQSIWGEHRQSWPANWRQKLAAHFGRNGKPLHPSKECLAVCPLHNAQIPHSHFVCRVKTINSSEDWDDTFLGALELFGYEDESGSRVYDWSKPTHCDPTGLEMLEEAVKRARKEGRLVAVYLPILVFGPSPRVGLTCEQRQLLLALTRELTHSKSKQRPDKARVILGGQADTCSQGPLLSACPYLENGKPYVGFTGNASAKRPQLRGRGYYLIGKTKKGWLPRAGYEVSDGAKERWRAVKRFLTDLQGLTGPFGLVAAGWNKDKGEWRSLPEMLEMRRTSEGRRWLSRCLLRVYTRDDYLIRWRRFFAEKLGFSTIPGGWDELERQPPPASSGVTINSAQELDDWMRENKITDQQLADQLGISRGWVSKQRSGRRRWSKEFAAKVAHVAAELTTSQPEEQ